MAEKTAIEDDRAGHRGPWIAQVMAGDGRNAGVRAQECRQIVAVQNRIVVRAVQGRKSVAELTLEIGFDGTATVFKDVIVNNDETGPRNIQRDISGHFSI
jgi:hypothetical protein